MIRAACCAYNVVFAAASSLMAQGAACHLSGNAAYIVIYTIELAAF